MWRHVGHVQAMVQAMCRLGHVQAMVQAMCRPIVVAHNRDRVNLPCVWETTKGY